MNIRLQSVFKWAMLIYLAILPMAGTIALRNVILVLLLVLMIWLFSSGRLEVEGSELLRLIPPPLWLWCAFLLFFPLWAVQPNDVLSNLSGQWLASLVAWTVGISAALVLGQRGPSIWELACASAFLVGLHLLLTMAVWAGLFGSVSLAVLSWADMGSALGKTLSQTGASVWHWQSFPWGFRGFDTMHGNLGYTASQAIALLAAGFLASFHTHRFGRMGWVVLGVGACLLSTVIASSRGAVFFNLLLLLFVVVVYFLVMRGRSGDADHVAASVRRFFWTVAAVGLVVGGVLFQTVHKDLRWITMVDMVRAGFLVKEPMALLCDGISPGEHERLVARLEITDPIYAEQIIDGLLSDGGRVVLMRAGLDLLSRKPFGLDGSWQSYKKIMLVHCGHVPVFDFAHTHNSWIDTALSLGWAGVVLLFGLLGFFFVAGWRGLRGKAQSAWAFALVLLSAFWMVRGLADSLYREHYLQMQALLLGYVWVRMRRDAAYIPLPLPTDSSKKMSEIDVSTHKP